MDDNLSDKPMTKEDFYKIRAVRDAQSEKLDKDIVAFFGASGIVSVVAGGLSDLYNRSIDTVVEQPVSTYEHKKSHDDTFLYAAGIVLLYFGIKHAAYTAKEYASNFKW